MNKEKENENNSINEPESNLKPRHDLPTPDEESAEKEIYIDSNASDVNSIELNGETIQFEDADSNNEDSDNDIGFTADFNLPENETEDAPQSENNEDVDNLIQEENSGADGELSPACNGENENDEAPEEPVVPLWTKVKNKIREVLTECGFPEMILMRFIGVYLIVSGVILRKMQEKNIDPVESWKAFILDIKFNQMVLWIVLGFVLLTFLHTILPKKLRFLDHISVMTGILLFTLSLMWKNSNYYLCIALSLVAVVFTNYVIGKSNQEKLEKLPAWFVGTVSFVAAGFVCYFIAITTVARHNTFCTSTFDFGIFVQMFHSMVTDFTAVTTCERSRELSHFCVHASYIYYLLAPFYAIFPEESTLLIAQAVLAMGGIIPLFLIAKNHNFKGVPLLAVNLIYVFYAGIISPCYYEFHENAFLPTLLMWLVYAVDKRKIILFYIMSVLTCIVKEDAPLYVICIALFFFFDEKKIKRLHGIIISALSSAYFIIITNWLTENGDGQMMAATRFGNLTIDPEEGFVGIIKNVLTNPSYFFSLFVHEDTLLFLLKVMIPLLFLPLITKKIHRFLLIIPFVIMNLVIGAGYGYAANIDFQYIFGPSVFLIYMTLINAEDFKTEHRNMLVSSSAVVSVITTFCLVSGNIGYYESYSEKTEYYQVLDDCLDTVPDDASVLSNSFYLPHIANREEVYMLDNSYLAVDPNDETNKTVKDVYKFDFYVLAAHDESTPYFVASLEEAGFKIYNEVSDRMIIYVNPNYSFAG